MSSSSPNEAIKKQSTALWEYIDDFATLQGVPRDDDDNEAVVEASPGGTHLKVSFQQQEEHEIPDLDIDPFGRTEEIEDGDDNDSDWDRLQGNDDEDVKGPWSGKLQPKFTMRCFYTDAQTRMLQAIDEDRVTLSASTRKELKAIPMTMQGDESMYTSEALDQRLKIKNSPQMEAAMKVLWEPLPKVKVPLEDAEEANEARYKSIKAFRRSSTADHEQDDDSGNLKSEKTAIVGIGRANSYEHRSDIETVKVINKSIYMDFCARLFKQLIPDGRPEDCARILRKEWRKDSCGFKFLTFEMFSHCMFETVDIWTPSAEPSAYADFAHKVLIPAAYRTSHVNPRLRYDLAKVFTSKVHKETIATRARRGEDVSKDLTRGGQQSLADEPDRSPTTYSPKRLAELSKPKEDLGKSANHDTTHSPQYHLDNGANSFEVAAERSAGPGSNSRSPVEKSFTPSSDHASMAVTGAAIPPTPPSKSVSPSRTPPSKPLAPVSEEIAVDKEPSPVFPVERQATAAPTEDSEADGPAAADGGAMNDEPVVHLSLQEPTAHYDAVGDPEEEENHTASSEKDEDAHTQRAGQSAAQSSSGSSEKRSTSKVEPTPDPDIESKASSSSAPTPRLPRQGSASSQQHASSPHPPPRQNSGRKPPMAPPRNGSAGKQAPQASPLATYQEDARSAGQLQGGGGAPTTTLASTDEAPEYAQLQVHGLHKGPEVPMPQPVQYDQYAVVFPQPSILIAHKSAIGRKLTMQRVVAPSKDHDNTPISPPQVRFAHHTNASPMVNTMKSAKRELPQIVTLHRDAKDGSGQKTTTIDDAQLNPKEEEFIRLMSGTNAQRDVSKSKNRFGGKIICIEQSPQKGQSHGEEASAGSPIAPHQVTIYEAYDKPALAHKAISAQRMAENPSALRHYLERKQDPVVGKLGKLETVIATTARNKPRSEKSVAMTSLVEAATNGILADRHLMHVGGYAVSPEQRKKDIEKRLAEAVKSKTQPDHVFHPPKSEKKLQEEQAEAMGLTSYNGLNRAGVATDLISGSQRQQPASHSPDARQHQAHTSVRAANQVNPALLKPDVTEVPQAGSERRGCFSLAGRSGGNDDLPSLMRPHAEIATGNDVNRRAAFSSKAMSQVPNTVSHEERMEHQMQEILNRALLPSGETVASSSHQSVDLLREAAEKQGTGARTARVTSQKNGLLTYRDAIDDYQHLLLDQHKALTDHKAKLHGHTVPTKPKFSRVVRPE